MSTPTPATTKKGRRPLYPRGWGSGNVAYVGTFRAFSMAVLGRSSLEIGDKIILPPQALQSINRLKLPFPLIFEIKKFEKLSPNTRILCKRKEKEVINQYKRRIENIYRSTNPEKLNKIDKWLEKHKNNPHQLYTKICKTYGIAPKCKIAYPKNKKNKNKNNNKSVGKQYCSVYEFSSPQSDSAYLPRWIIENIGIIEGDAIELQSQFNIEKGSFCKLQPFKQEFMDKVGTIGYKSTLEHSLRHYSVLSLNQRIVVEFNHFPYQCIVKDTKPQNVISILGCTDLEIEFEEPLQTQTHSIDIDNDIDNDKMEKEKENETKIIDGDLLKKLGVPLEYNQQINLAAMILENRKLEFNDMSVSQETEKEKEEETEEKEKEKEREISVEIEIGENDVECSNCGKYVHSMSIQMHEMHCQREFVICQICNKCIRIGTKHFDDFHKEFKCICSEKVILFGFKRYNLHILNECKLRNCECLYCDRVDIAHNALESHQLLCGENIISCSIATCNKKYKLKDKLWHQSHDCGIVCVLCNEYICHSKDKLLHLLTICKQRRAICNYCGIFRTCIDMEQHRKFCGSRSEKCDKCNEFVSLMNMEPHKQSNCQWFNNNQLSVKKRNDDNNNNNNGNDNNDTSDSSILGLLSHNYSSSANLISASITCTNKQLCPYCKTNDLLMEEEEFQIHIATKHPSLVNELLTQTIMASFQNPDILKNHNNINTKKKKKKRKSVGVKEKKRSNQWNCNVCTFKNTKTKSRCMVCQTAKQT